MRKIHKKEFHKYQSHFHFKDPSIFLKHLGVYSDSKIIVYYFQVIFHVHYLDLRNELYFYFSFIKCIFYILFYF